MKTMAAQALLRYPTGTPPVGDTVVLTRVAHHLLPGATATRTRKFVATVCTRLVMGPEVGHVFRVVYAGGVR